MKKLKQSKEPIRLRAKKLKDGSQSLYLDYYNRGTRQYEFLKLYLVPERSQVDKDQNEETLRTANAYKAQKIVELQNGEMGFSNARVRAQMNFVTYMRALSDQAKQRGTSTYQTYDNGINHFIKYAGEDVEIGTIDKDFCKGFVAYLKRAKTLPPKRFDRNPIKKKNFTPKPLSPHTQYDYFGIFNAALNKAVREDIIKFNPVTKMDPKDKPEKPASNRSYLTMQEVRALAAIQPQNDYEKAILPAFLFSCFCGLRLSDVEALTWGKIKTMSNGTRQVDLTQVKTKEKLYLPLSDNALKVMPERGKAKDSESVFNLPKRCMIQKYLKKMIERAGINKPITFHCSRHTFATLDLAYGADLYTVSKLLGHKRVTTTQVYAKIVDESKRKAVDLIPAL